MICERVDVDVGAVLRVVHVQRVYTYTAVNLRTDGCIVYIFYNYFFMTL